MSGICDADVQHLKPGKKVMLISFQGLLKAPGPVERQYDYWQLIGSKAKVADDDIQVLTASERVDQIVVTFDGDIRTKGLISTIENSLWVDITDLKLVCRY